MILLVLLFARAHLHSEKGQLADKHDWRFTPTSEFQQTLAIKPNGVKEAHFSEIAT